MKGKQMTNESEPGHSESELLKMLLAVRNISCPVCGYNLRGIASNKCPECGRSLELRVVSGDLRVTAWLVALLSAALPLGASVVFTIIGLSVSIQTGFRFPHNTRLVVIFLLLCAVYSTTLLLAVRGRRRIWKLPQPRQWRFALWFGTMNVIILGAVMTWLLLTT